MNPGDALSYMSMLAPPNLSVATTMFVSNVFDLVVLIEAFFTTGLYSQAHGTSTGNSTNVDCSACNDSKQASFSLRCQ